MTISQLPIALTMGEPAGISAEITFKTWCDHRDELKPFFLIDDPVRLKEVGNILGSKIKIGEIKEPLETLDCFAERLPVLSVGKRVNPTLSNPDPTNGEIILGSIKKATDLALSGKVSAVVTNPIKKSVLYSVGFSFPGHTEYLADLSGVNSEPVMMIISEKLKVVTVTRHLSLLNAIEHLCPTLIIDATETTLLALKDDFGINDPRVAIAGLNPHAGENGSMGNEEITIIKPAIEALNKNGYNIQGPLPADSLFHTSARKLYDVIICMYHDQALIPIKTLDFGSAVNVTLGLPFIRTSPDHGTALNIAGMGTAHETSLVAALKIASQIVTNRAKHKK